MSFEKLDQFGRRLEALAHAQSMLAVDEAVQMPVGGGEKRAEAMALLASMYHEEATAPGIADWIAAAEQEDLGEDRRVAVAELRRVHTNLTCLTPDFVARQVTARVRSEQLWRELRPKGDWLGFLPALDGVIELAREEAQRRAEVLGLDPYDAMMEQYDPGNRIADIAPVFETLKGFLKDFVPEAIEAQARRREKRPARPLDGPYATDSQRELGLTMMAALGFDFTHGRLDVSHHPFCGGVPTDVRITTRYRSDDFLVALMGTLHETGHALYEQGLPETWSHWPSGHARGMAMHESQSLFVEKQLARGREFWEWALPHVREHLGALEGWDVEDVLAHVHHVGRGLIRVDADEATYPLHVILRFELERELIAGTLGTADIPEAWDARMREYLDLSTIDIPEDGPMQDVHWPSGAFGYFPSYTLGALIAAQQWAALEAAQPRVREEIAKGHFEGVNAWRAEHIWSQASRFPTPELIERSTGRPLDPQVFMDHLKARYLG